MASTLKYGSLTEAIIGFYAKQFGRDEQAIVETLVSHFARQDSDLNPEALASGGSTEELIAFYAKTYEQEPTQIIDAIVADFAKNDPDFDLALFARQQQDPSVLREMEIRREAGSTPVVDKTEAPAQCPFIATVDRFEGRELSDHQRIDDWFSEKVDTYRCPAGLGPEGQSLRGIHARGLGVLQAKLHILEQTLPALPNGSVRPGVFGKTNQTFPVILRYSTSGGPRFESMPDNDADQAVGLGLKILTERGKTAHDLLFINSPVFMTNDPVELVFQEDASALRDSYAASREQAVQQVFNEVQYSASAFRWGEHAAVKYRLRPTQDAADVLPDTHRERYESIIQARGTRCLEEALALVLDAATAPLDFNLEIQFADPEDAKSHGCPVDDERIDWKSPWYCVARLEVPGQTPVDGESLAFNPFHVSSALLLPLGRLNRARLSAYANSQRVRHTQNKVQAPHPYDCPLSKRVAVVGGGASGLASALALASFGYQVDVYERLPTLGGHACAKDIDGGKHRRDPAFGAFRARQWPNLWALLQEINVEPISHGAATDWFDSPFAGWFAKDGHTIERSPEVIETMQKVVLAFTRALRDPEADGKTVGDLFDELEVSDEFLLKGFVGGIIHYFAGHPIQTYLDYPLRLLAWMWLNNADRIDSEPIELFRVDNDTYIQGFAQKLKNLGVKIHTGVQTQFIERTDQGVLLQVDGDNPSETWFSKVVLAVQPHHALKVLGECASDTEREVLGGFEHTIDKVIVHQDASQLPSHSEDWKLFNVELPGMNEPAPSRADTLPITIYKPCVKDGKTPVFATYDYAHADTPQVKGESFTFEHARVNPQTQRMRQRLPEIQGNQHVHFCGSWSRGLTLHEDAIVTGIESANLILGQRFAYPLLDTPVPLPAPFEAWQESSSNKLGGSREAILEGITEMIREILPHRQDLEINEETELQGVVTSSLHLARLANALSDQMADPDAFDVSELLHMETVGELIELIIDILGESGLALTPPTPKSARRELIHEMDWTLRGHPVTLAQQSILVSHFLSREPTGEWNIAVARWLDGAIPSHIIADVLTELATEHAVLRTRFKQLGPRQFEQSVLRELPQHSFFEFPAASDKEAMLLARAQVDAPIDITERVLRVRVIRRSPTRAILLMVVHHAVSDGWSTGLLLRQFWTKLAKRLGATSSQEKTDREQIPQQLDAAYWEIEDLEADKWKGPLDYWREQLQRPLPRLAPPTQLRARAYQERFVVRAKDIEGLRSIAKSHKTSLNVLFTAVYAQVLGRITGLTLADELLVRMPVAARRPETEQIIGCFADGIVLRIPSNSETFTEALTETHKTFYEALANPTPFALLWKELNWGPAELLELNQVILNLEQTIAIGNDEQELGPDYGVKAISDNEESGTSFTTVRSMLSLNETDNGDFLGVWQWSEDLADENAGSTVLICPFQDLIGALLAGKGSDALQAAAPSAEVSGCPFHDTRQNLARDTRDVKELTQRYDASGGEATSPDQDVHIGTFNAHFKPKADIAKAGVFAEGSSGVEAIVRLSTRFGAGGLAIKFHKNEETLHDLLFLTTTTIPNDAVKLVNSAAGNEEHGGSDALLQPYYTISAFGWENRQAVKFRLQPSPDQKVEAILSTEHCAQYHALEAAAATDQQARATRLELLLSHAQQDIVLELSIQMASHPDITPVNDTLVEWTTPYTAIGELCIPAQTVEPKHDDSLRFHPFSVSDAAYLPLGRLNRIRREIYRHVQAPQQAKLPHHIPDNMKVAIVGGGASGLRAALELSDLGYQVTVFERSASLGGHACTKEVLDGKHMREPAFGAFRRAQWPNLIALLDALEVEPKSHGQSDDWLNSPFVGWWREGEGWTQPAPETEEEAKRFIVALTQALDRPEADGETVGDLIQRLGLSNELLATWFVGGVIHYFAGHPLQYYLDYPARLLAWMWLNNAARENSESIELLKVDNQEYMSRFESILRAKGVDIQTGVSVVTTSRSQDSLTLSCQVPNGPIEEYRAGHLVLAIQPQHALTVLGSHATAEETKVLGGFHHTVSVVKVYKDSPLGCELPKLLTIKLPPAGQQFSDFDQTLPMVINKECARDGKTPIYAVYDYAAAGTETGPDAFAFEHVQVTPQTQKLRKELNELQGNQGVHFCGSWSRGLTLHEDAIVTALETVNRLVGAGRSVEILNPPIPLHAPFEERAEDETAEGFGSTSEEIVRNLVQLLSSVIDTDLPDELSADTKLSDIQLSSLHFARLANAIATRLPPDLRDEVDILVLLQMESIGELSDFLAQLLSETTQGTRPAGSSSSTGPDSEQAAPDSGPSRRDFINALPENSEKPLPGIAASIVQFFGLIALTLSLATSAKVGTWGISFIDTSNPLSSIAAVPLWYLFFTTAFTSISVLAKHILVGKLRPGRYPLYGRTHLRWWLGNLFLRFGQQTVWAPFSETILGPWLLNALGANIGSGAQTPMGGSAPSFSLIDADLLEVGKQAYVRNRGRVRAHMFVDGSLVLATTQLGSQSTVWSRSIVEPGATVEEGALLDTHAVLSMGHRVAAESVSRGIPATQSVGEPPPGPVRMARKERFAQLLCALLLWPLALAAVLYGTSELLGLLPSTEASIPALVLAWVLAYPAWLLASGALGITAVVVKQVALGKISEGESEEDYPIGLPLVRSLSSMVRLMSWLWPRSMRWRFSVSMGAKIHPNTVTDESFLDLAYADLFTREDGTFFSSAAFLEFAKVEKGRRVLYPITLSKGSYVGAYSTLASPQVISPLTMVGACSALAPTNIQTEAGALIGVPARPVPLNMGDIDPDAFAVDPAGLRRLNTMADLHRYLLFTLIVSISWGVTSLLSNIESVESLPTHLSHAIYLFGAWFGVTATFTTLVGSMARSLRNKVDSNPKFAEEGISRKNPLLGVWATSLFHMLPLSMITDMLSGTQLKTIIARALGAQMGQGVYLDHGIGLSDLPYLRLEDGVSVNEGAALIAHSELPNGNISFKPLHLGAKSSVLWSGYLVGGTTLPTGTILGSLSRPFDSQTLDENTEYNNTPCRRKG